MNQQQLKELLISLTLEEKIGMVHGCTLFKTKGIERLNIPGFVFSDGPMGVRMQYDDNEWKYSGANDDFTSYLPSNTALASTFSRDAAYRTGCILGEETRGRGKDMILAPGVNIHRSPLCGRNFEYMSEDPYLSGEIAVPYINGVQTNQVAACVKHYALNNQETRRNDVNVEVSDRALFEIYLPAFRAAVKAGGTLGVMGSYNKFRETYCSHHSFLIDTILRNEWGFDGILVSDWGSIHDTVEGGNVDIDVDMRVTDDFDAYPFAKPLSLAIQDGTVSLEKLDAKIWHILTVMNKLRMFDDDRKAGTYNSLTSHSELLDVAEESIILLKNEKNLLPLSKKKTKKLLVVGDNANRQHALGGGSAEIKALYEISPLLGLKMELGGNCEVIYEPGYYNYVIGNAWGHDDNSQGVGGNPEIRLTEDEIVSMDKLYLERAIAAAKDADAVIFFGGLNHDYDVEGADKQSMKLPNNQDYIINELLKVRPDLIVSIMTGSPVDMSSFVDKVSTLLYYSYNGMEGGHALAKIIFGSATPSGKLSMSLPRTLEQSPAHKIGQFPGDDTVKYEEDIYVGYRYYEKNNIEPLFAFGHGLSYTEFQPGTFDVLLKQTDTMLSVKLNLPITNIGDYDGACSVQFYVKPLESNIDRPIKELRGFDKVFLKVGATGYLTSELDAYSFSYYNEEKACYEVLPGKYEICAGFASNNIITTETITIVNSYCIER